MFHVIDGEAVIIIDGQSVNLKSGEAMIIDILPL
ncbi:hypothetical protein ACFLTZ_03175 [Chloroflexota bacterium]